MAVSVLRFKISLFDSSAEGQQVAEGLDLLAELVGGEARGQDCEEVSKHQRIQFSRPSRVSNNGFVINIIIRYRSQLHNFFAENLPQNCQMNTFY